MSCTHSWHSLPESYRSARCPGCGEIHPWGLIEGVEYLKKLRGEAFSITYPNEQKGTSHNMTAELFIKRLAFEGGASIVCTAALTPEEIESYRQQDRMFVDDDGYGYVIKPSMTQSTPMELARLEDQSKG